VGDFNGDGIQDLATVNELSNTVTVLLGNGAGAFTAAPGSPFPAGSYPTSAVVGDFNGDGIEDLAIANSGSGQEGMQHRTSLLVGDWLLRFCNNVRQLSLGGIALIWLFRIGTERIFTLDQHLLRVAFFIFLALMLHFLQYLIATTTWFVYFRYKEKQKIGANDTFLAPLLAIPESPTTRVSDGDEPSRAALRNEKPRTARPVWWEDQLRRFLTPVRPEAPSPWSDSRAAIAM
jgi:hypothetical protein